MLCLNLEVPAVCYILFFFLPLIVLLQFVIVLVWRDFIDRIENQSEQAHNGIPGGRVAKGWWRAL